MSIRTRWVRGGGGRMEGLGQVIGDAEVQRESVEGGGWASLCGNAARCLGFARFFALYLSL